MLYLNWGSFQRIAGGEFMWNSRQMSPVAGSFWKLCWIDYIHDTRHLCTWLRTDEIKTMWSGFWGCELLLLNHCHVMTVRTNKQLLVWANFITCLHPEIPSDTAFIPLILKCVQSWWVSWFMNNLGLKIVSVKMVCYCIFMLLSSKVWITLSGKD